MYYNSAGQNNKECAHCSWPGGGFLSPRPGTRLSALPQCPAPDTRRGNIWRRQEAGCIYHLACQAQEGQGWLFTHLICLRDKASFDTDSRRLVRAELAHKHWKTPLMRVCVRVCAHMEMKLTNTRLCWEPLTLGPGSSGDTDWQMQPGGDSQTAGGQRLPFYLCPHLADCFFSQASSATLHLCLSPPPPAALLYFFVSAERINLRFMP